MYLILRQWGKSKWGFIAWCDTLRCDVPFLCVSEVLWSISSFLASWLLLQSANVATITNSWWRWRWWRWWWRTNTICISLPFVQLLRVQTPSHIAMPLIAPLHSWTLNPGSKEHQQKLRYRKTYLKIILALRSKASLQWNSITAAPENPKSDWCC